MNIEQYKKIKLEELAQLIFRSFTHYSVEQQQKMGAFLSQTIDELIGCVPKQLNNNEDNGSVDYPYDYIAGYNLCLLKFNEALNQLNQKK